METHNIDPYINEQLYKIKSIELCPNTIGQQLVGLMIDPPKKGRESDSTVEQFQEEHTLIAEGLKERAKLLTHAFNDTKGVSCAEIQGAMYAFPRIYLPEKAIAEAKSQGVAPDFLYSMQMLNETGIISVPGAGFGQRDGTHHFRITNLVAPTKRMEETVDLFRGFNEKFHQQYA